MSLENPSQKKETVFTEQFPHLRHLTEKEQEHFLILHTHNEKREEADKKTEEELLAQISTMRGDTASPDVLHSDSAGNELDSIHMQAALKKVERVKRIATNVTDFIPVIGSAKMILEGIRGKQYGTEKEIKGVSRVIHTASGALFLGLDMTGVGVIASELGKGAIKIGERAALKKLEKTLAQEVVVKESAKLVARGEARIDKAENIVRK